jgi:aminomuconate-semialdehyde/2-hydroxymuconate-6-semialdehyde dehydrogenase
MAGGCRRCRRKLKAESSKLKYGMRSERRSQLERSMPMRIHTAHASANSRPPPSDLSFQLSALRPSRRVYTQLMQRVLNLIDGELVEPRSDAWLDNIDPATGETIGQVPDSGPADVDAAAAASGPGGAWMQLSAQERSRLLLDLADAIEARLDDFASAESIDTGKPITAARTIDIPRAIANFRYFATAILHTESQLHETDAAPTPHGPARAINYTLRRPRGVAGCISPWNLPLYLFTWKIAPALATGCPVVAKPSELTPTTAFMLAELSREILPPGALNIVHGKGETCGAAIIEHPGITTITFTGSTKVGQWIGATAGGMLKRVSLELGGKNPFLVFADADLDRAMDESARAAFSNQGQICLCGSRVLVEQSIVDDFVNGLVARAQSRRIGDPLADETEHGALTSSAHLEKVDSYIRAARDLGGSIHCGGRRPDPATLPPRCRGGAFYEPTVITGLPNECAPIQEEIFGPVVTVQPFDSADEAVRLANSTPYGLAASLWTSDLTRAHRLADRIEAGVIWINCWMLRDLRTPFGGMKQSGVGREGGLEALRFFTEPKNVCVRI